MPQCLPISLGNCHQSCTLRDHLSTATLGKTYAIDGRIDGDDFRNLALRKDRRSLDRCPDLPAVLIHVRGVPNAFSTESVQSEPDQGT